MPSNPTEPMDIKPVSIATDPFFMDALVTLLNVSEEMGSHELIDDEVLQRQRQATEHLHMTVDKFVADQIKAAHPEGKPVSASEPQPAAFNTSPEEEARLMSLHFLTPEQRKTLTPEQERECRAEIDFTGELFSLMQEAVDDLYPHCRKYFKAMRAVELDESLDVNTDVPLYKAFRVLFSFADKCAADPALLPRLKRNVVSWEQSAQRRTAHLKAKRKAKKKAEKCESARLAVAPNVSVGPDTPNQPAVR